MVRRDDDGLRRRMKAIAHERRRVGYRRVHVLVKREGYRVNHKKLCALYREEKLAVRRRGGRKRVIGTRAPMTVPPAPNDRWSLDFVSDQLTCDCRFRNLTVVDDCTRLAWHWSPIPRSPAPAWRGNGSADDRTRQAEMVNQRQRPMSETSGRVGPTSPSRHLQREVFPPGIRPLDERPVLCSRFDDVCHPRHLGDQASTTRSLKTRRQSISYSRSTTGGRLKCQVRPLRKTPRLANSPSRNGKMSCTV